MLNRQLGISICSVTTITNSMLIVVMLGTEYWLCTHPLRFTAAAAAARDKLHSELGETGLETPSSSRQILRSKQRGKNEYPNQKSGNTCLRDA